MHHLRSTFAAAITIAATVGWGAAPGEALAQPAQSADTAQARFEAAQKKYIAGDHGAALGLFREALAGTGSPNARLYVARCLRELGQLPEAYKEMRETARDAGQRAATEKRYVDTQRAAEAELAQLEAKVARVVVTLPGDASGAEVRIGGQPVPVEQLGQPVATTPGEVTVEATAPGKPAWSKTISIAAGGEQTVEVVFGGGGDTGSASGAAGPVDPGGEPDEPSSGLGTMRTAGIVVAAVGVAGMGLFTIAGLSASSRFDTLQEACGDGPCTDEKYNSDIDTGETLTTLANVGLVLGIVGIVGGTTMIVLGGPKKSSVSTTSTATPRIVGVGVSPFGVRVRGAF
jgi:hypothetical protein